MGFVGIREKEALKIIPFLLSDGGITPKSKTSWRIFFRNNSPKLIAEFRKKLFVFCGNNGLLGERNDNSYMVKFKGNC